MRGQKGKEEKQHQRINSHLVQVLEAAEQARVEERRDSLFGARDGGQSVRLAHGGEGFRGRKKVFEGEETGRRRPSLVSCSAECALVFFSSVTTLSRSNYLALSASAPPAAAEKEKDSCSPSQMFPPPLFSLG